MNDLDAVLRALWGRVAPGLEPAWAAGCRPLAAVPLQRGLQIYRENAKALSVRALGAAFPRVRAWMGPEFPGLAWAYARAHPPVRGDAAEWGESLPTFLADLAGMDDAPPALARLDWALHRLAVAPDVPAPDPGRWQRLAEEPADCLRVQLTPHGAVHHVPALVDEAAWSAAQVDGPALGERPEPDSGWAGQVLVWRQGWQPVWTAITEEDACWWTSLGQASHLAEALDLTLAVHPDFDLSGWLVRAHAEGWLLDVR